MTKRFKILKNEYKINFKLSLIASLIIFILLFLFFPYVAPSSPSPKEYQSLLFTINDLAPNTKQDNIESQKPTEPKILIPDVIEEPEILPDIKIVLLTENESAGGGTGNVSGKGAILNAPQLPFVPRQILEVLPENIDENIKGLIVIKLKIDTDGKVVEFKVMSNTTGSQKFLQSVINAANKSKWQPVKIKNNNIVYWVEKTYRFN